MNGAARGSAHAAGQTPAPDAPDPGAGLYVGLMSGTSLDGIDGVLVAFERSEGAAPLLLRVLAHAHAPYPAALASEFLRLNTRGGVDELHRSALAANALARLSADVVTELLDTARLPAAQVRAIGSHGQTVRHQPGAHDGCGYTLQVDNPALLAELTGIDVVADLRRRDVAAGGQGAPLVPAFHRAAFGRPGETVAVLNIGGIANLTVLHADGNVLGFDCGPGNALMDGWWQRHGEAQDPGVRYDAGGAWAAAGAVHGPLLQALRAAPYFHLPAPKSTGRDLFHATWLDAVLAALDPLPAQDVQATLAELTASVCADDIRRLAGAARRVLVCGGGAFNMHFMARLRALLPDHEVAPTDAAGLPALQVEAAAFAWLARACVQRTPLDLGAVTGARGARILGALYPGS